ncbi:putative lipid II flippase FtsW [Luteipulveratus sp. YIM 133132]|uniref:Probable peptidoglycan glycosyltransferase FtsW n=1 Tax=Luteipulveratus flavus TaxID=3031728 RepID=A0ABT6C7E6_9MICO|nr:MULTISPECIES: putative lipid II flippase FtsW [unclassified Luteipulveratus]MDE9366484.1 putative lipid II flippase FtsW [Luteipulveratus sp. YIM 133132]MDF8264242.1 putative lipid II flippase FtsW [Luteipulveratus sp. YIM 133296]
MSASSTTGGRESLSPWSLEGLRLRLDSPVAAYYILLGASTLLVTFGLVMVLSASSVTSYQESGSSYTVFRTQAMYAAIGLVVAVIASRVSVPWWKRLALPAFFAALVLQLLVFSPLGNSVKGNRNWLAVGGFSMQPSELGKVALVLVGALVLTRKRKLLAHMGHALVPFVPMAAGLMALVLLGHDLGTVLVLLTIAAGILFVAGLRVRVFVVPAVIAAIGVLILVKTSDNRMGRVDAWLGTCADQGRPECYQKVHGLYALADGGWWGLGIGESREKWDWLPEAHNDFIFAIIGEELGLPGTLIVVGLYAALAFAAYRIITRSSDFFVRLATAGIMVWIVTQAMINIGSVTGLLPIIGVPLPLVSAGGSAMVTTMLALGMLVSFARHDPACRAALEARPSLIRRSLAVLPLRKENS